jgi:hypothetical protein
MKYLCLVYLAPDRMRAVPDAEGMTCGDALRGSGALLAAEALLPPDRATPVRRVPPARDGRIEVREVRALEP